MFLADKGVCARIAGALDPSLFDRLLEIGPGGGALTEHLFPKYGALMKAVEIDRALVGPLRQRFPALDVINADFLSLDLPPGGRTAYVSNLPYECSTAILDRVLQTEDWTQAVFMFQKEVARRITAPAGGPEYGYLTLSVAARAESRLLTDVKAGSFRPVPNVDSSVLVFRPRRRFASPAEEQRYRALLKKAFAHRRKTLVNSLALCGADKALAAAALDKLGLPPAARAQELTLEHYAALAGYLP